MRNFDPNDRFHLWKKHSGFKKGLATDIIFGDVRKWNGPVQYSTTMCTDYDAQKNMFHQNPKALEEYNRQQRAHLDASVFVPQSTAGKPLGLLGKKTENHISFGDYSMKNDSRMQSLTASDFKPHSLGGTQMIAK